MDYNKLLFFPIFFPIQAGIPIVPEETMTTVTTLNTSPTSCIKVVEHHVSFSKDFVIGLVLAISSSIFIGGYINNNINQTFSTSVWL